MFWRSGSGGGLKGGGRIFQLDMCTILLVVEYINHYVYVLSLYTSSSLIITDSFLSPIMLWDRLGEPPNSLASLNHFL